MRKNLICAGAVVALCTVATVQVNAQTNINTITTAVPFLRVSPDARSTGMGETGIATAPDAYSPFFNNGKTVFNEKSIGVGVTYTPWLKDLNLPDVNIISVSGYYKLDEQQALNLGLRYFSLGNIQFTDNAGNNIGQSKPREMAIDLGYSRKLSDKSGLGISLRYISSDLADGNYNGVDYKKGSTVAGDLHYYNNGTKNSQGSGFSWGATLSNLGGKISYTNDAKQKDFIPANLGLGGNYTKIFNADNKLSIALDLNKLLVPTPSDTTAAGLQKYREKGVVSSWMSGLGDGEDFQELTFSVGTEYWYKDQFALRLGYFYESPEKGNRRYLTAGAGLKYSVFGLNFAYIMPSGSGVNRMPLSNTMRFSLLFDFDGPEKTKASK